MWWKAIWFCLMAVGPTSSKCDLTLGGICGMRPVSDVGECAHTLKPYILRIRSQVTSHVATNRGQTKVDQCPKIPGPRSQGGRIPSCACVCVRHQAVAGTFPQFLFPGGQGPLVATYTEILIGNRDIRMAANIFSPQIKGACPFTNFLDMRFAQCTNATYLLVGTDCVLTAPLTFPLLGVMFRHTLRVSREISLTVPDHQR